MLDNYDMFVRHQLEQDEKLERCPKCELCGDYIQEEKAVYYDDCWICSECEQDFLEQFKREVTND